MTTNGGDWAVIPGTMVSGRYRLERIVDTSLGHVVTWSATDVILDRSVRVVAPATDADAARVLEARDAARRAALVDDSRIARILDVGSGYIVTEATAGDSVADLLRLGRVEPGQARAIAGEAANALEVARARGVHHGAFRPATVHRTTDGKVRVTGLAIDGALRGGMPADPSAAARADAVGLIEVLYTMLTGVWPGDPVLASGLPLAPRVDDQPCAPKDLVPGVPNDLDTLCVVTLGPHDDGPRTPAEVATELAPWPEIAGDAAIYQTIDGPAPAGPTPAPSAPHPPHGMSTAKASAVGAAAAGAAAANGSTTATANAGTGGRPVLPSVGAAAAGAQHDAQQVTATVGRPQPDESGDGPGGEPVNELTGDTADRPPVIQPRHAPIIAPPIIAPRGATRPRPGGAASAMAASDALAMATPALTEQAPEIGRPLGTELLDDQSQLLDDQLGLVPEEPSETRKRRLVDPTVLILAAVLIVVAFGALFAWRALSGGTPDESGSVVSTTPTPSATPTPTEASPTPTETGGSSTTPVIASAAVTIIAGQGNADENPGDVTKAYDGDPNTSWNTRSYKDPGFKVDGKTGVGLAITLAEPAKVSSITLQTNCSGGNIQLRATTADDPAGGTLLAEGPYAPDMTLTVNDPVETQNLVLWITQLPTSSKDGKFRSEIDEITLQ